MLTMRRPLSRRLAQRWGTVSYWNLENLVDSYDSNTLTNNNATTFTAGKIGNAATFAAASSQSLSRASNSGLQTGPVDFWGAAWANATTLGADRSILSKFASGGGGEFILWFRNAANRFQFKVYTGDGLQPVVNENTLGAPSTGTWYFVMATHEVTTKTIGISVNGNAFTTAVYAGTLAANTSGFFIGATNISNEFWNGQIDSVAFGKSPPLGIATLATEIRDTLYNNGNGRSFPW